MVELTRRYIVMQMAAEGPFDITDPDGPFVLKPWKDPAALQALIVYRDHCYPELALELDSWIKAITAGPKIRGGVGSRNELTAPTRRKPAAKAKGKIHKVKAKGRVAKKLKHKAKNRP
jgi:hypothetical protein